MSAVLELPVEAGLEVPEFVPDPIHWSVAEFCELMELPKFQDRKFILIDGEVLEMPIPNPPHDTGLALCQLLLGKIFHDGFLVRNQCGFPLDLDIEPIPDLAVVPGSIRDYATQHPKIALLFVEISDSTLRFDLKVKSHLYAAAKISEYWVVDVTNNLLHIHREPLTDADAPRGFRYASVQVLTAADSFAPLAFPEKTIRVADLLP